MDDSKIIELFWKRSEAAITETSKKYGRYCYYIAFNILHSHQDAEECINDAFLRVWNAIPPKRPNRLSTYLGKITRNLAFDKYKRYTAQKRGLGQTELVLSELEDCIPSSNNITEVTDETLLIEAINLFLYQQQKIKHDIFISRYWYTSSIRDIAGQYHMSESKVSSMLFRLRKDLKIHLEKEGIFI